MLTSIREMLILRRSLGVTGDDPESDGFAVAMSMLSECSHGERALVASVAIEAGWSPVDVFSSGSTDS